VRRAGGGDAWARISGLVAEQFQVNTVTPLHPPTPAHLAAGKNSEGASGADAVNTTIASSNHTNDSGSLRTAAERQQQVYMLTTFAICVPVYI